MDSKPLPPLPELPTDIDGLLRDCADFVEASLRGDDDHDIEWVRNLARRLAAARPEPTPGVPKDPPKRGVCWFCSGTFQVRHDGRLRHHTRRAGIEWTRSVTCMGAGTTPADRTKGEPCPVEMPSRYGSEP